MTTPSVPQADALLESPLKTETQSARARLPLRAQWAILIGVLVLCDGLLSAAAFGLAYWIRFQSSLPVFRLEIVPSLEFYENLLVALVPVWLLTFALFGLYQPRNLLGGTKEYAQVFRATAVGMLIIILAGFLEPTLIIARGWVLSAWVIAFLLACSGRFILRRLVYRLRQAGYFMTPALIIGANEEARLLADQLTSWKTSGLELIGLVRSAATPATAPFGKLRVLGSLDRLDALIERYGVGELVMATSALSRTEMLSVFERYGVSDRVNLRMSSGLFEIITTGLQVKEVAYIPLVTVDKVRLKGLDLFLKWILDYGLTLPGLILLSPLLAAIALAVKLDSRGPVIHRRRVMGLNGRQFDAFKFRTMRIDGDTILAAHPQLRSELAHHHKIKADPRITRVGKFLRRWSLDELPQLFNVLRREMSFVGPRMISPEEMPKYNQWGINLLTVRPGITGLWQVSGRSDVSYHERVRLDMYYIRNWSIWIDLHLLIQTIPAVLKGRGAY